MRAERCGAGENSIESPILGCSSRAGPATCEDTPDGPMCVPVDQAPPPETAPAFGQCGGVNYDGPTTCDTDLVCTVTNEFYSSCQPAEDAEGVPLWQQCGGEGYEGPTNCLFGATCVELNQYFSQCRP